MAIFQLKTFEDIVDAVAEELKIQSSSTTDMNRIKRDINIVYQDLVSRGNFWWIRKSAVLQKEPYISAGTANAVQNSTAITLTVAPSFSVKGHNFKLEGHPEIYSVESHTAGATSLVLSTPYTGATNATSVYKLWLDYVALPTDLRQTTEVYHQYNEKPLEGKGLQEFRRVTATSPSAEARPYFYTTTDFFEPDQYEAPVGLPALLSRSSAGYLKTFIFSGDVRDFFAQGTRIKITNAGNSTYNGEFVIQDNPTLTSIVGDTIKIVGDIQASESATADATIVFQTQSNKRDTEKFRKLLVHPSLFNSKTTIHVDYIIDVVPLEEDSDEPLIPIADRIVLLYGALSKAWARERNEEESIKNLQLYEKKLKDMLGRVSDSLEVAQVTPSQTYLNVKRQRGRSKSVVRGDLFEFGAGGGGQQVTGIANRAAVFNATTGILEADTLVSITELQALDNVTDNIQDQLDGKMGTAASSTDNAVVRWDGTSGTEVQDSSVLVSDIGAMSGLTSLSVDNITIDDNEITSTDANGDIDLTPNGTGDINLNADTTITGKLTVTGLIDPTGLNLTQQTNSSALPNDTIWVEDSSNRWKVKNSVGTDQTVVYADSTDSLTNKTINADDNTITNLAHGAEVDNPTSGVHGVSGNVVGTSDAQTLTNKTIAGGSNTISGLTHGSQVDNPTSGVHGVTGSVVGTTDSQQLSGKTFAQNLIPDADNTRDLGTIAASWKDLYLDGDATIQGNLTVNGTTTTLNTATLDVEDVNITVNKNGTDASSEGAGITIDRSPGTDGSFVYENALASKFKLGALGSEVEITTVSASQVITNKDIDGGTASNTRRITLPKASTATLSGLTRKEGTIVYDTTVGEPYYDDGASLVPIITPASAANQNATIENAGVSNSVAASALTITLTQADGSSAPTSGNPVRIAYRNTIITSGAYSIQSFTATQAVIVPSTATLGHTNGGTHYIYVYSIYDGSNHEIAISSKLFTENALYTTNVLDTSSDSSTVLYSTTARTGCSIRLLHRLTSVQTTAGTWAAVATESDPKPLNIENISQTLDISSSGNFSGAQPVLYISRTGRNVTLTFPDLAHSSVTTASSASGFIPALYRPIIPVRNITSMSSTIQREADVATNGTFSVTYRNHSGSAAASTSTSTGTISWITE